MKRVLLLLLLLLLSVLFISMAGSKPPAALAQEPLEPVTETPGPLSRDRGEKSTEPARFASPQDSSPIVTGDPHVLSTNGMIPAEDCGVPLGGPFGKDVEILLNNIQYQYGAVPDWYPSAGIPREMGDSKPSSNVAAAALSTEKIAAVWRESGEENLYYSIWDSAVLAGGQWDLMAQGNPTFSDVGGWKEPQYYSTIQTADVDGDGQDELLARWPDGMHTYDFNPSAQKWEHRNAKNRPFSDAEGWGKEYMYRTIQTADIDGDGKDELLGRHTDGMRTYRLNSGSWEQMGADYQPFKKSEWPWGYYHWGHARFYSTVQTADVNGDGRDELLGRHHLDGMRTYYFDSDNKTWELLVELANNPFPENDTWRSEEHYSTIQTADVDGDGQAELLARGADGWLETYRFKSDRWESVAEETRSFKTWTWPQYYSTIQTADVDGDGRDELLGRDSHGIITFRLSKDEKEWEAIRHHDPPFSDAAGWNAEQYYSTIQTADVDGDGRAELLARGPDGLRTYRFDLTTKKWNLLNVSKQPFTDGEGWDEPEHYSTIQTADVDGDGRAELLGRGGHGMFTHRFSDSRGGWAAEEGWVEPAKTTSLSSSEAAVTGNPTVLATGQQHWEVYTRNSNGQIQFIAMEGEGFGEWQTVKNTANVNSDPLVISRRKGNTLLFYRDDSGGVRFTEREGGVEWRDQPLQLLSPSMSEWLFLPVVRAASSTAAAALQSPDSGQAAGIPAAFKSELSAISRNENHVSLFGVDNQGQLWVRDWTSLNNSDWRDTKWVRLMKGVEIEKPAVASRHSNHIAVAVRDTSGKAYLIEWNAQSGWGAPVSINKQLRFSGPLALAVPDSNELFLFGADNNNVVLSLHWTAGSGWQKPQTGPDAGVPGQVMATVVRRPDDVMVLERTAQKGLYWHYTSQGRGLEAKEREINPPAAGHYRNQVLARVQNRSYYIALDKAGDKWRLDAYDLDGDVSQASLTLDKHAFVSKRPVSVIAADVDFDGSDELLVATRAGDTQVQISVVNLSVTNPDTAPALNMKTVTTKTATFNDSAVDFALAAGDLNGDSRRNVVILATTLGSDSGKLHAAAKIYKFELVPDGPGELREKSEDILVDVKDSPFNGHWELEVATGRLETGPGEQLVVAFTGEQNCPNCDNLRGFVNTYSVKTGAGAWSFTEEDPGLADNQGDPVEFTGSSGNLYRSAVATGDLDADGYEEIAAWYLDHVFTIDTNDLDENGDPAERSVPLEPKKSPPDNDPYFQSSRALALDDIDRDGRMEIAAAARLYDPDTGYGNRFALLELLGGGGLQITAYGKPQQEPGTVLMGDVDGDGLVSELAGCQEFGEYMVVAVVNGLPRPYKNGAPVFDSLGSFSKEKGSGSSVEAGVTTKYGASLTVGYEQEFKVPIPFLGLDIGGVSASVSGDFMNSHGVGGTAEVAHTHGDNYEFAKGLGLVVYNKVTTTCYYYDLFSPASPEQSTRAMSCQPDGSATGVMALELWHEQSIRDEAGNSWVDVGHRAPDGTLTNDLAIPGNYADELPVDFFKLLLLWGKKSVEPQGGPLLHQWYASKEIGGALNRFSSYEDNVTVAAGIKTGNVKVETSGTFGRGFESSFTASWSESTAFAGGYSWPANTGSEYSVVPYVYQATAKTLAGTTYPYFEMDYYVP